MTGQPSSGHRKRDISHATQPVDNAAMIRLLVGLGNPGPEYEDTRHNAGFWWIDQAARKLGVQLAPERSYFGLAARASRTLLSPHAAPDAAAPQGGASSQPRGGPSADCGPVWLLEPMTYMNLSGKSVAALARFFKVAPQEILVVHDELDLDPGQMKLKLGGSHAGHNGLKDIHAQVGSPDYWRLRLGIGHPGIKSEVVNYVLRKPPLAERELVQDCINRSLDSLDLLLAGNMERAMMKIHVKPAKPKPTKDTL